MTVAPPDIPTLGVVSSEERRGLYWATLSFTFPQEQNQVILPRNWVVSSPLFHEVSTNLTPTDLTGLSERRAEFDTEPSLEKCVTEAVYERAREEILPDAPSRLNCLFAGLDADAAVQFATTYLPPPTFDELGFGSGGAVPVSTADGRWVALDMHLFGLPPTIGSGVAATARALEELQLLATRYWKGQKSSDPWIEILAERLWLWTAFIVGSKIPPPYREFVLSQSGGDTNG